jgi:hypothetical protein
MRFILFLSLTLTTLRIFPQNNPSFRHIPPDATAVFHFNCPVITTRLSWKELTAYIPLPQRNTSARELVAMLKEPVKAGLDTTRDIFLIETSSGALTYISLLIHLSDSTLFSTFLRQQEPGIHIAATPRGSFMARKNSMGAAWDQDLAVLTFVQPAIRIESPNTRLLPTAASNRGIVPTAGRAQYSMLALATSADLFRGFDDSTCIHDPLFLTGFSDNADVHAWTRPGSATALLLRDILQIDPTTLTARLPIIANAFTNNGNGPAFHTLTTLRFDTGRIAIRFTTSLPEVLQAILQQLTARPLDTAFAVVAPGGSIAPGRSNAAPLGLLSFHVDTAALTALLDKSDIRPWIDTQIAATPHHQPPFRFAAADIPPDSSGSLLCLRIDLKSVAALLRHLDRSAAEKNRTLLHILEALDQLQFNGGRFVNGQLINDLEIKMAGSSENSLRSLYRLFR